MGSLKSGNKALQGELKSAQEQNKALQDGKKRENADAAAYLKNLETYYARNTRWNNFHVASIAELERETFRQDEYIRTLETEKANAEKSVEAVKKQMEETFANFRKVYVENKMTKTRLFENEETRKARQHRKFDSMLGDAKNMS